MIGWAKVRKTVPTLKLGKIKPVADSQTLEAIIANRYEVMAKYAKHLRSACRAELARLSAEGAQNTAKWRETHLAQRWLPRHETKVPPRGQAPVANTHAHNPPLAQRAAAPR